MNTDSLQGTLVPERRHEREEVTLPNTKNFEFVAIESINVEHFQDKFGLDPSVNLIKSGINVQMTSNEELKPNWIYTVTNMTDEQFQGIKKYLDEGKKSRIMELKEEFDQVVEKLKRDSIVISSPLADFIQEIQRGQGLSKEYEGGLEKIIKLRKNQINEKDSIKTLTMKIEEFLDGFYEKRKLKAFKDEIANLDVSGRLERVDGILNRTSEKTEQEYQKQVNWFLNQKKKFLLKELPENIFLGMLERFEKYLMNIQ